METSCTSPSLSGAFVFIPNQGICQFKCFMGVLWFPNQSVSCLIRRFFLFQFVKYKGHNGYSGRSCGMNTTLMPLKKTHSNRLWETLYQDRIELGKNSVSEILTSITGPGLAFTQLLCGLERALPLGDLREVDSTFVQTKRPPFLQQVQPRLGLIT